MTEHTHKQARNRYKRLFWPAMLIYLVVVLGGSFFLATLDPEPIWLATTIALGSSLPLVVVMYAMMRYFEEADEFIKIQQLRAFGWGTAITISAIFIVGFLQMFDVISNVEVFWFGPGFFFAYGIASKFLGVKEC